MSMAPSATMMMFSLEPPRRVWGRGGGEEGDRKGDGDMEQGGDRDGDEIGMGMGRGDKDRNGDGMG